MQKSSSAMGRTLLLSGDTLKQSRHSRMRWRSGLGRGSTLLVSQRLLTGWVFSSTPSVLPEQATDTDPLLPDAWFLRGLALYRLGNYTGATEALGHAVALLPDHAEAWFFLGNCHFLSGDVKASIECFDRLLSISGRYPKALYNKGVSLAALGRYDEAVEAYRACLDMSPGVAVVLTNLGVVLANVGHSEEAIRSFDEALAIDPKDPLTWHNKGLALAKLGREEEAMDCFRKYQDLAGRTAFTKYQSATVPLSRKGIPLHSPEERRKVPLPKGFG